jgi:hypothetical protein
LAIGEALISVGGDRHVILDPFQDSPKHDERHVSPHLSLNRRRSGTVLDVIDERGL